MITASFSEIAIPRAGALILPLFQGAKLTGTAAKLDSRLKGALKRAIAASDFSGKLEEVLEVIAPGGVSLSRILIIGAGDTAKATISHFERIGAVATARLNAARDRQAAIIVEDFDSKISSSEAAAHIALGVQLRSYRFDNYLTTLKPKDKPVLHRISILCVKPQEARKHWHILSAAADGMTLARDLVNEPPNVLFPAEFANRAKKLIAQGVKVEVLGVREMRALKMNALLGVGQGSVKEPKLVVMQWRGGGKNDAPHAFVGKGVTFDTGGISLKPPANMGEMKGDMAGAAAVTGLMRALAARKAPINVVGIAVLAENMPDGNAQRPGDIVTSMSGQTIEVLNTDAEGRLILADALWYAIDRFKPRLIVNLATLTGAILVALGSEYAGLFSNNDQLSEKLTAAGEATGEKLWRLPMNDAYDRMIKSNVADMQNIGGRDAGSITAAQFLQRFVKKVPWAHLDIAGVAWKSGGKVGEGWGTGFGVRLLDEFLRKNYEAGA